MTQNMVTSLLWDVLRLMLMVVDMSESAQGVLVHFFLWTCLFKQNSWWIACVWVSLYQPTRLPLRLIRACKPFIFHGNIAIARVCHLANCCLFVLCVLGPLCPPFLTDQLTVSVVPQHPLSGFIMSLCFCSFLRLLRGLDWVSSAPRSGLQGHASSTLAGNSRHAPGCSALRPWSLPFHTLPTGQT